MKKYIALLMALVMGLSVAGCGQSASSSASSEAASSSADSNEEEVWLPYDENLQKKKDDRDATGKTGAVAACSWYASKAGLEILQEGGNAFDAAAAVAYTLGVVEPYFSGLGGGGFMTIYNAETKEVEVIDFREIAPAAANAQIWLDEAGEMKQFEKDGQKLGTMSSIGGLSVATPGEVAGMEYLLENYGSDAVTRQQIFQPAIDLANNGYLVTATFKEELESEYAGLAAMGEVGNLYLNDGMPYEVGDTLTNPDLATALQAIADGGRDAFYTGDMAQAMVDAVQAEGGCLTMEDMANYEIHVGEPVHGTYRGYDVYSSNLPSSGGSIILEILNILENFDVGGMDPESPEYFHLLSEAFKLGFADRTKYMGDPAYVDVPVSGITNKDYAAQLAASIDPEHSQTYEAGDPWPFESESTTHYSIMDAEGNMVAVTKTVDATFASGLVAEGTGILLNDTLFDFSVDPESPNVVAGSKRPLSSMSPTLILKDGQPFMSLGAPGTTRIITGVAQVISKVIDHGMDIQDAIDAVRMHDDFGTLILEDRVSQETKDKLADMGHELNTGEVWFTFPCVQACMRTENGILRGAADPRRDGLAMGY